MALLSVQPLAALADPPPQVAQGLAWLSSQVQADGSVAGDASSMATVFQARAETLRTLRALGATVSPALATSVATESWSLTEYLARRAIAAQLTGTDAGPAITALVLAQNPDGGFGPYPGFASAHVDTAWAVLALKGAPAVPADIPSRALSYLVATANPDGGFGLSEQSTVHATSLALEALASYSQTYVLTVPIERARAWLTLAQNAGAYATTLDNAVAAIALARVTTDPAAVSSLQATIIARQDANGSWAGDPYLTSVALRALVATANTPPASTTGQAGGTVVDDVTGLPLAAVLVQATGPQAGSATSSSTGGFTIDALVPGSYTLQFTKAGYATATRTAAVAAGQLANVGTVRLSPSATSAGLQGRVRDGATGAGLAGATISVQGGASTTADGSGSFLLTGLAPGAFVISVQLSGYQTVTLSGSFVAGTVIAFSPSLYATGSTPAETAVSGRIVDADDSHAIAGATVKVGTATATTDSNGDFRVVGMGPGAGTLEVSAPQYRTSSIAVLVAPGPNALGTLSLAKQAPSARISGTVRESGANTPIGGAVVRLGTSLSATTNSNGRYELANVTQTTFQLQVTAAGYVGRNVSVTMPTLADTTVDVSLDRTPSSGITMRRVQTARSAYDPFSSIEIEVEFENTTGNPVDVTVFASILDAAGNLVIEGFPVHRLLGPGLTDLDVEVHNTSELAGNYRILVRALNGSDGTGPVIAEGTTSFLINELRTISGTVNLDPPIAQAGTGVPVTISADIFNHGNLPYAGGPVELRITLENADPSSPPKFQESVTRLLDSQLMNRPVGASYDGQGNLYTINSGDRRIYKRSPQGVTELYATLPGSFTSPSVTVTVVGLVADPSGTVYVLNDILEIFAIATDAARTVTRIRTNLLSQTSFDRDSQGRFYVAQSSPRYRVMRMDSAGGNQVEFLGSGLNDPFGLTYAPDGNFYAANSDNSIARVTPDGQVTRFAGSDNVSDPLRLASPKGITNDAAGNLYVANSGMDNVIKFTTGGVASVYASGGFFSPSDVKFDPSGNLFVLSTNNNTIFKVTGAGATPQPFVRSLAQNPQGLAYDSAGNLFALASSGVVRRLGTDNTISDVATVPAGSTGIALNAAGQIFVATAGGAVVKVVGSTFTNEVTGLSSASGLAFDSSGTMYIAESNRISSFAGGVRTTLIESLVGGGDSIAVSATGDRYILNFNSISRLTGTQGTVYAPSGFAGQAIALAPDGTVYVQETGSTIKRVAASGAVTAVAAPGLPTLGKGIVADASGNVWVIDRSNRRILLVSGGTVTTWYDGAAAGLTSTFEYLTSDGSNGFYVAMANGAIVRVDAAKVQTAFASFSSVSQLAYDSGTNRLYARSGAEVRGYNAATKALEVTFAVNGSSGALAVGAGQVYTTNGSRDFFAYTPTGTLVSTVAGFLPLRSITWDGARIVFADAVRTFAVVPGQFPTVISTRAVNYLAARGGTIYASSAANDVISMPATPGGVFTTFYSASDFRNLQGIAVRGDGSVTVASFDDHRVVTFNSSGQIQAQYPGLKGASALAIDPSGNVYVANSTNIVKFNPNGVGGSLFANNTQIFGLAFNNGRLYASNYEKLVSFDANGAQTLEATSTATNAMGSLAFASDGRIYAADTQGSSLRRKTGDKMELWVAGVEEPKAVRVAPDGAVYATNGNNGTVVKFLNGVFTVAAANLGQLRGLAISPAGKVYIATNFKSLVYRVEANGLPTLVVDMGQLLSGNGTGPGNLDPDSITVDGAEGIAIAYNVRNEVYRVTYLEPSPIAPAGTVLHTVTASLGPLGVGSDRVSANFGTWLPPYGGDFRFTIKPLDTTPGQAVNILHVGPNATGTLASDRSLVPPGSSSVRVSGLIQGADFLTFSRTETAGVGAIANNVFSLPMGMAADASGNIYMVGQSSPIVKAIRPNGTSFTLFTNTPPTATITMRGMIPIDSQQRLYVPSGAGNVVMRVPTLGSPPPAPTALPALPQPVISMVRDSMDRIYALTMSGVFSVLHRLTPADTWEVVPVAPRQQPEMMTIDGRDNIYIKTIYGDITRIAPDGTSSVMILRDASADPDPSWEGEGSNIAGDCWDSLMMTPRRWVSKGVQLDEEYALFQMSSRTGQVAQILDGRTLHQSFSDLDVTYFDRFSNSLLFWNESDGGRIFRVPMTCGSLNTDLHVVASAAQPLSGFTLAPAAIIPRANGDTEYVWNFLDVSAQGRTLRWDTALSGMALGETRALAQEAFLVFNNTFAPGQVTRPLTVPKVATDTMIDLTVSTDAATYPANTDVHALVNVKNRDTQPRSGTLTIEITDAAGARVALLAQQAITIAAGAAVDYQPPFNTATILTGNYKLKAVVNATGVGDLARADASFVISAGGVTVLASVAPDRVSYEPRDTVNVTGRVRNLSVNSLLTGASVDIIVRNPSGVVVLDALGLNITQLVPLALADRTVTLRLDAAPPGMYSVELRVYDGSQALVGTQTASFGVLSSADTGTGLRGTLTTTGNVNAGGGVEITGRVRNDGNAAIPAVALSAKVVNPQSQAVVASWTTTVPLTVGQDPYEFKNTWDTTGASAGTYVAVFTATVGAREIPIGQAPIVVGALQDFSFAPVANATTATVYTSNTVTIAGLVKPMAISIAGGEYRIGATGAFVTTAGSVTSGDTVTVRVTSAAVPNAGATARLTVGTLIRDFVVTTAAAVDTTPDTFTFTPVSNAGLATLVTSNTVTIAGIDVPVAIRIAGGGGEYSINGGAWRTADGTIANGDTVAVRLVSSSAAGAVTSTTLTVSDRSGTFTVTTLAQDTTPDPFSFPPQDNVPLNSVRTSDPVTITGINVPVPIHVAGGEYSINGGAFTVADGVVSSGSVVRVRVTASDLASTSKSANLTVSAFSTGFMVTTEGDPNPIVAHAISRETRVLVLASEQRRAFLDGYLASLGVEHKVVTDTDSFRSELRCGRWNTYWITGGAAKLTQTLGEEVREAVFRGDALIVDGARDARSAVFDEVTGITFVGTPALASTVVIAGAPLTAGTFTHAGGALKLATTTGVKAAGFGDVTGDPAIVFNTYGLGHAVQYAFDLTGTLIAQPASVQLRAVVEQSLDAIAPPAATVFMADSVVPITTTIRNPGSSAQDIELIATLPAGMTLLSSVPATYSASGATVTWRQNIAAGQTATIEWTLRAPQTNGLVTIQFQANRIVSGAPVAAGTGSLPIDVRAFDPATTETVTALSVLTLPVGPQRQARDRAVTNVLDAQGKVNQGLYEAAIAKYLAAGDELGSITAVPVTANQAAVDRLMQQVSRRWCVGGSSCPVGTAAGSAYSLMVFGSASLTNGQATGSVGVGGAAALSSYTIASLLSGDAARLVVGGSLSWNNGSVGQGGSGVIRVAGSNTVTQSVGRRELTTVAIEDWIAIRNAQQANADRLAAIPGTPATTAAGNAVNCTGSNPDWNVCTMTAAQVQAARSINLTYPSTANVLVNVTGSAATVSNGQTTFNAQPLQSSAAAKQVVFNLAQMGSLVIDGWGWGGSILAPRAAVTHRNSFIDGQAVFNTLSSTGSFRCTGTFQGVLP